MTWYPDLSDYRYWPSLLPMRNVGWLAAEHGFPTGDVPASDLQRLVQLAQDPDAVTRGIHGCEWCPRTDPSGNEDAYFTIQGTRSFLGHAEIHVAGRSGNWYAAPTLVLHYIDAHGYRPPAEFLAALRDEKPQALAELQQMDDLVMLEFMAGGLVEDDLRSLLRWLQAGDADERWSAPGESSLCAVRDGDRVTVMTHDPDADPDEDDLEDDEVAECDRALLAEALVGFLAGPRQYDAWHPRRAAVPHE